MSTIGDPAGQKTYCTKDAKRARAEESVFCRALSKVMGDFALCLFRFRDWSFRLWDWGRAVTM
jgi:hypothetical protein